MGNNYYIYRINIYLKTKIKYKMIKSILEHDYIEPTRPYSSKELESLRTRMYESLRLSKYKIYHTKCRHFYYVRKNSRKEKEILENKEEDKINLTDIGNCSVCWKIHKTDNYLKDKAYDMLYYYNKFFKEEEKKFDYTLLDLETVFYKWLYINIDINIDKNNIDIDIDKNGV